MTPLESVRAWLRTCPLIKDDKLNLNYLGGLASSFSLEQGPVDRREDILGLRVETHNFTFAARLDYGVALAKNISAAEFFAELDGWVWQKNRTHNLPQVEGFLTDRLTTANAGIITEADANTARYQLQMQLTIEEA